MIEKLERPIQSAPGVNTGDVRYGYSSGVPPTKDIYDKINELIEAVNKMEKLDWETYKKEMEERFKAINPN